MSKQRFHIGIKNAINDYSLELHFLDVIADSYDWWMDKTTNMVEEVVNKVKSYNPSKIKLIIDSEGGYCDIGFAIYNFLKNYNAVIETEVIGMAGSIASVIAMAADKGKLRIARNGFVVIHQAWGGAFGNASEIRAGADVVEKYTAQVVDVYVQRTGKTKEEIESLIANGDYWMTGSEAIAMGFADELLADNNNFLIAARIGGLSDEYHNIPKNLLPGTKEDPEDNSPSLKSEFMKFKDKVNAFIDSITGKKVETTKDTLNVDVANLIGEPMTTLIEGLQEEVANELKPITENVTALETKLTNLTETITASVTAAFETRMKTLEDANAKLTSDNEALLESVKDTIGKSSEDKKDGEPKAKIIGSFGSAAKAE